MIKIGPLTLTRNKLLATAFSEMTNALEAMEAGDYDLAYGTLEAMIRPADPLSADDLLEPYNADLTTRSLFRDIVNEAPAGMYLQLHSSFVSTTASLLAIAKHDPGKLDDRDWLAALLMFVTSCGLDFELDIPDREGAEQ